MIDAIVAVRRAAAAAADRHGDRPAAGAPGRPRRDQRLADRRRVPFACGFALGRVHAGRAAAGPAASGSVTSLFLGTALSISSVKIVAMVVREMNFMRRNLGQVIVSSAIIEDTIGWIIIAITFGLAQARHHRLLSARPRACSARWLFLALSLTIGRRAGILR